MILFTYGPHKWFEKVSILQMRTQFLCNELDQINIKYFREPFMNIVTIHAESFQRKLLKNTIWFQQQHNQNNKWYKIVLMDHVEVEHLTNFIDELKAL
jgi:tyrosine decarboxylase/aspartate 1-decarboxylase